MHNKIVFILVHITIENRGIKWYYKNNCKCQYKNVGFVSYKHVGKPTFLYDIF